MTNLFFKYVAKNAAWLTVPPLFLNLFMGALPPLYQSEHFWAAIPLYIQYPENILRLALCILPFFMPLQITSHSQKIGLGIYLIGLVAYYLSWGMEIYFPTSAWSASLVGFLAPGYTPLLWFIGIGLVGDRFFFKSPYRSWMYLGTSALFITFHLWHAATVFCRGL